MEFVDLDAQYRRLEAGINQRLTAVFTHGRFIMGPEVKQLEEQLAAYVGAKHAIACANGTDALQIALMALKLLPGDEVIMPAFSYFATAEVCLLLGLKPVFADIDPQTYTLDVSCVGPLITSRTRAIMPVSLFGQCADMDAIGALAAAHGLAVIEDGAQSFGAQYKGRRSLALSTIGCTSFFPSKPLGCYGDGGMCFTDDEALAVRLRMIRVHGQPRTYQHDIVGVNSRLDSVQAAILLEKFSIFPDELERRQAVAARYTQHLAGYVDTPVVPDHNLSAWAQYTIATGHRDALKGFLQEASIPSMVYYPMPMPAQAACGEPWRPGTFAHSEAACARVLSLPMHPYLQAGEQDTVIDAVRRCMDREGGRR